MLRSRLLAAPHGFTTRAGGVSTGPYTALNLSAATGDDPAAVAENRRRVRAAFGGAPLARLSQVHGTTVHAVRGPGVWEGDGLVSAEPGLLLAVSVADCYPLLLEDPAVGAVAALHAGWRGVLGNILAAGMGRLAGLGAEPARLRLAVGPGIAGVSYQVSAELAERFAAAGYADAVLPDPEPGRARLDLPTVIRQQALELGIGLERIEFAGRDTFRDPALFSYRRDGAKSGRMWGLIQVPPRAG
ncbi:laccase domain protein [Oceanithermus desulfurans NBRC 100063]|uniref:Purine nucleoside phosphorylase n=1 Tax=Oceanithermus desulfurans NBRC 100063 TaxID=1227550 RepID=A0A511RHF6_9DEIN|nr:laccase domain protein [Oceanithermus desulfurans NBRC 100063]